MSTKICSNSETPKTDPAPEEIPSSANLLVVLGMHRSGTSALAGLLNAAGAAVSAELLDDQPTINQKGFWEDSVIVALNDRLLAKQQLQWFDWRGPDSDQLLSAAESEIGSEARAHLSQQYLELELAVCKDPRFCRTLPFWKRCITDVGLRPAYLLCLRHPAEVAASLEKRDALPLVYGTLLWMTYTLDALTALEGESYLALDYAEILESPANVVQCIIGLEGTTQTLNSEHRKIKDAVDANLRHHSEHGQTLLLPDLQIEAEALYRALLQRPGKFWSEATAAASSYLAEKHTLWSLIADFALSAMRRNGELVDIGEKHGHALEVISEKDRDISGLARAHDAALATIAQKDRDIAEKERDIAEKERDIARLGAKHGVALETIAERDVQLQDEVAWREHLELELRKWQAELEKCQAALEKRQAELAELSSGVLALPVRLRRKAKHWVRNR